MTAQDLTAGAAVLPAPERPTSLRRPTFPAPASAVGIDTDVTVPAGPHRHGLPGGEPTDRISDDEVIFAVNDLDVRYGSHRVLAGVNMRVARRHVTAIIGPSGCGKSTFLRCFNRMNDGLEGCRVDGKVAYHGVDLYGAGVSPVEVRRRVGMVFQKPVAFPRSVFDNVAYGLKIAGVRKDLGERVEQALIRSALWDEVKDRLKKPALELSGGQQQRLCIARAVALEPEVLLMDEPCSALDPIATSRIEELMRELRQRFTIVIVTHNMQQAARVSDRTAFFTTEVAGGNDRRTGVLVEYDTTERIFSAPADQRTEHYVTGRFG